MRRGGELRMLRGYSSLRNDVCTSNRATISQSRATNVNVAGIGGGGEGGMYLSCSGAHGETGEFSVHFHVDCFVGLNSNDQFISRNVFENDTCNIIELD